MQLEYRAEENENSDPSPAAPSGPSSLIQDLPDGWTMAELLQDGKLTSRSPSIIHARKATIQ